MKGSRSAGGTANRSSGMIFCLIFSALLLSSAAAATESRFIYPLLDIPMRRGAGEEYKIIRMASAGDKVELLEERDEWARVQMQDGFQGWLPKRMLTPELPPAERLEDMQKEKSQLEQKIKELNLEVSDLKSELTELQEHRTSEEDKLNVCIKEQNMVRAEHRAVEDTNKVSWFLAGAGVLLAGWMLGRISLGPPRKRSRLL